MEISIVCPVYKGEPFLQELVERLEETLNALGKDYELIFVDDCGPDRSWEIIESLCAGHPNLRSIKLSRNFGQHYAITAGLNAARGKWIVVMDCDLQDQPEEITRLYQKAQEGFDIVFARRAERQDSWRKRLSSQLFYKTFGFLTDTEQDASIANFGIYHQRVISAVLSMKDSIRYFPTMVRWVGFKSAKLDVAHASRSEGKSSYTWRKLIQLASNNIVAFSDKPLRLLVSAGFYMSLLAFLAGAIYLVRYLTGDIKVMGFTSVILAITFLSGLIIITLGLIGIYLGKTFDQTKDRPTYIVHKTVNMDHSASDHSGPQH